MKIVRSRLLLPLILFISAILRAWNITNVDIQGDPGHLMFRALGWFDYMLTASGQTTPFVWFGEIPWWGNLSFHDHPPLIFAIQKIFFIIFGDNSLAAALPFLIAGVASTFFVYAIVKKFRSETEALIAGGLFAVSSMAVWSSRTFYFEGITTLLILLSFYHFVAYLNKRNNKSLYLLALFTALAMLGKYTSGFLIPAYATILYLRDERIYKKKSFWLAITIGILVLLPAIIYNAYLVHFRGHFDAALSFIFGIYPEDYSSLSPHATFGPSAFLSALKTIFTSNSILYSLTFITGFILLIKKTFQKNSSNYEITLVGACCMAVVLSTALTGEIRYTTVIAPFIAMASAYGLSQLAKLFSSKKNIIFAGVVIILAAESLYAINTNIVRSPFGPKGITFSPSKVYNQGFVKAEKFLSSKGLTAKGKTLNRIPPENLTLHDDTIYIVDERADWFPFVWHFRKYWYYYDMPVFTMQEILKATSDFSRDIDALTYMDKNDVKDFWFVYATENSIPHGGRHTDYVNERAQELKDFLDSQGSKPEIITNDRGEEAFLIYHYTLK